MIKKYNIYANVFIVVVVLSLCNATHWDLALAITR